MPSTQTALLQDHETSLNMLQARISYHFADQQLLLRALIHSSFAFEHLYVGQHNETLEFLGDSVLDLTLGSMFITRYPELREGKLTRIRAAMVNEHWLAGMAKNIQL